MLVNFLCLYFSLDKRFPFIEMKLLNKLLFNLTDCPEIIERLNFKVNLANARCKPLFTYLISLLE